jgi:hypothetical protein
MSDGAWYWKGVKTHEVYQFRGGFVPANFVDGYGNPLTLVSQYTNPQGVTEDLVLCLPFGMVQLGYAGPPSVINPPPLYVLAPGHIYSTWEQELQP